MAIVFGVDIPVLEFLLVLNAIMLFYVILSMFEIRSLIKLRKDIEIIINDFKKTSEPFKPVTQPSLPSGQVFKAETNLKQQNQ